MTQVARLNDTISHDSAAITSASSDVKIGGIGAARINDTVANHSSGHTGKIISAGSSTVFVNGRSLARVGDPISCGASISTGSGNVNAG